MFFFRICPFLFFGIFLLLVACRSMDTVTLRGHNEKIVIHVEIADDPEERQKGLMYRATLPEGQGMLFVFDTPAMQSFWMKNTRIPLDILFFDAGGQFVSSASMDPCRADPCPLFPSQGAAKYALEVPAGFLERHTVDSSWILQAHVE